MTRNIYFRLITALLLASALTACEDEDIVQSNGSHAASNAFWAQYDFVLGENSYMTRLNYQYSEKLRFYFLLRHIVTPPCLLLNHFYKL